MEAIVFAIGYLLGGIFSYLLWGQGEPETYVYNITVEGTSDPDAFALAVKRSLNNMQLVGTYTTVD